MNNIKSVFSINDLENLSGIKAHTIRMWEKRYTIFSPNRNTNNVRFYTTNDLKKILTIAFLNNFGYKISKIAKLSETEIISLAQKIYSDKTDSNFAISKFKLSMFNFDAKLFHETYDKLLETKDFEIIFYEVFIPLLDEIGFLWQTETLTPIHEHFISSLIRQKLFAEIEQAQKNANFSSNEVYVLFLPMGEIHEIGIILVNYLLLKKNKQVVYLGENVPMENLTTVVHHFNKVNFVSYFTVQPEEENLNTYLDTFHQNILVNSPHKLLVLGKQVHNFTSFIPSIQCFTSIKQMLNTI
ncbi:MerR family transcriptional regulator [Flavobacterium sp.]|uniref:MerR family transcriptional regulator n=1 Tax=Flavobacterium sp. TaxID=239 RepID=UPI003528A1A6